MNEKTYAFDVCEFSRWKIKFSRFSQSSAACRSVLNKVKRVLEWKKGKRRRERNVSWGYLFTCVFLFFRKKNIPRLKRKKIIKEMRRSSNFHKNAIYNLHNRQATTGKRTVCRIGTAFRSLNLNSVCLIEYVCSLSIRRWPENGRSVPWRRKLFDLNSDAFANVERSFGVESFACN